MISRHAAALALLGWYLMMPAVKGKDEVVFDAPLSAWHNIGAFDSAAECEEAKVRLVNDSSTSSPKEREEIAAKHGGIAVSPKAERQRIFAVQCIETVDPRLAK